MILRLLLPLVIVAAAWLPAGAAHASGDFECDDDLEARQERLQRLRRRPVPQPRQRQPGEPAAAAARRRPREDRAAARHRPADAADRRQRRAVHACRFLAAAGRKAAGRRRQRLRQRRGQPLPQQRQRVRGLRDRARGQRRPRRRARQPGRRAPSGCARLRRAQPDDRLPGPGRRALAARAAVRQLPGRRGGVLRRRLGRRPQGLRRRGRQPAAVAEGDRALHAGPRRAQPGAGQARSTTTAC